MECAYTLGSLSVAYFFRITVTLTSGLSFRRNMSRAYLILFVVGIPNPVFMLFDQTCPSLKLNWQSLT